MTPCCHSFLHTHTFHNHRLPFMFHPITTLSLLLVSHASGLTLHSGFTGKTLSSNLKVAHKYDHHHLSDDTLLTMRKQKASDKRTTRRQRNQEAESLSFTSTMTSTISPVTPMELGAWNHKTIRNTFPTKSDTTVIKSRGRSRKREALYNSLASYNNHFLELLTAEFLTEVRYTFFKVE